MEDSQLRHKERNYSYQDLVSLGSTRYTSGFGEMVESEKPSSPAFSFSKGQRAACTKLFHNQEMALLDCAGREGSGPAAFFQDHNPKDALAYPAAPAWRYVSRDAFVEKAQWQRRVGSRPRYEYYKLDKDLDCIDVDGSDQVRRVSSAKTLFGTGGRFPKREDTRGTPGPQYEVGVRPETAAQPSFSFGYRRLIKGSDPLAPMCSTTDQVGPGTYFRDEEASRGLRRKVRNNIKYSIGREKRFGGQRRRECLDETYDTRNKTIKQHYDFNYDGGKGRSPGTPIEPRAASAKPELKTKMLSYSFGKAGRNERRGCFKDTMSTTAIAVRIGMPKF